MGDLNKFRIAFQGMSTGTHNFIYKIDETFFAHFENSPVSRSNVWVDLTFDKRESMFDLHFQLKGFVELECDRCLEPFEQVLDHTYDVYVKFETRPDKTAEDDEDVIYISRNDNFFDVSQLIYEFVILSIPGRKVPEKADCCFGEIVIKNEEPKISNEELDPRWDSLKQIKQTSDATSKAKNLKNPQG